MFFWASGPTFNIDFRRAEFDELGKVRRSPARNTLLLWATIGAAGGGTRAGPSAEMMALLFVSTHILIDRHLDFVLCIALD